MSVFVNLNQYITLSHILDFNNNILYNTLVVYNPLQHAARLLPDGCSASTQHCSCHPHPGVSGAALRAAVANSGIRIRKRNHAKCAYRAPSFSGGREGGGGEGGGGEGSGWLGGGEGCGGYGEGGANGGSAGGGSEGSGGEGGGEGDGGEGGGGDGGGGEGGKEGGGGHGGGRLGGSGEGGGLRGSGEGGSKGGVGEGGSGDGEGGSEGGGGVGADMEARMVQEVAAVAMAAVLAFTWACLPFRSASLADCWPWSSALASPSGLGRCGVAGACPGCVRLCLPWLCEPLL